MKRRARKIICFGLVLLCAQLVRAQESTGGQPDIRERTMYLNIKAGILAGESASPILQVENGVQLTPRWSVGMGAGLEALNWEGYVPIYGMTRFNLLRKRDSPFAEVMLGYEMPMTDWSVKQKAFTTGLRIGAIKYTGKRFGIQSTLAYRFTYLTEQSDRWEDFETVTLAHRIEWTLGVHFR
ncbi:MAG: hypothetical protein EP338_02705 [Bacteroidetes bacterium]|nr:MAG: hypothetical protein EP338_02705 [Bacteroidota bacterium]